MRRYMMTDEVVKHDDDLYNEALQTNARLMVSPYASTLNYTPARHQYHHHHQQQQQQQQLHHLGLQAADTRWLDVTTVVGIATDEEVSAAEYTTGGTACPHVVPVSSSSSCCRRCPGVVVVASDDDVLHHRRQ